MRNTVRISKAEYDELREYRFKQLFCQVPVTPFAKELKDKNSEIDKKNKEIAELKATIARQDKLITEKELYEKLIEQQKNIGYDHIDLVERVCRLQAKIEAQENPYFF